MSSPSHYSLHFEMFFWFINLEFTYFISIYYSILLHAYFSSKDPTFNKVRSDRVY